jgi:hypothetical protein
MEPDDSNSGSQHLVDQDEDIYAGTLLLVVALQRNTSKKRNTAHGKDH